MEAKLNWLNSQIDLMQADMSLDPHTSPRYEPDAEDIAILQFAARLNASHPGAGTPDEGFLGHLRARMLASVIE